MGGQRQAPAALTPRKIRYPLYRRLGEPHSRSGRLRKISPPPPGFDPRTVQPVPTELSRSHGVILYIKNRNIKYYRKSCCFYALNLEISLQFQRFKALIEKETLFYVRCTNLNQYVHTCVYLLSQPVSLFSHML